MPKLTREEQEAVDVFDHANEMYNAANDQLEQVFRCRLAPLLEAGDWTTAREYIRLMPESVAKIFVADSLRYARGDYDEFK